MAKKTIPKPTMKDFMSPHEKGNPCDGCKDEDTIVCEYCDKTNPYSIENQLRIAKACAHCAECKQYTCPVPNAVQNEAGKEENREQKDGRKK